MAKENLSNYKTDKKPIAKLTANEMVLGGDSRHINPKRKVTKKKSFLNRLFS